MIDGPDGQLDDQQSSRCLRGLTCLAVFSGCLYAAISLLSWRFDFNSAPTQRPILTVLLLFGTAFISYLVAIRLAMRTAQDRRLLTLVVGSAVLFRVALLPSVPIQEIDIYRYLWDGSVTAAGVNPFRYSPESVRAATADSTSDEEFAMLVRLRDQQPALHEVLHRVHFGELPTVYPPTSQAVFAAATLMTPSDASVWARTFVMKAWFVAFDLATLFVVIALLKQCQMPLGLCLIYAWCPLLLKEVANSGHTDAVAVFLTTLAVYLAARLLVKHADGSKASFGTMLHATLAAVVLALAVGAKLYPIVLAPLLFFVLAKRLGWPRMLPSMAAFALTTLLVLTPMTRHESTATPSPRGDSLAALPNLAAPPDAETEAVDPSLGVTTFLRRWEMNDFIFLVLIENLKPSANVPPGRTAWFSIIGEPARLRLVAAVAARFNIPDREVPFVAARAMTATVFLGLAMWFAWRAARQCNAVSFCQAGFLTLAWFWLLCPTQNPWYWTWALPLLPFARSRAWLAVSGLVLIYYLRFWLGYHWPNTHVSGTPYVGHIFFDFIITWLEFAPWFAWLAFESWASRRRSRAGLQVSTCSGHRTSTSRSCSEEGSPTPVSGVGVPSAVPSAPQRNAVPTI